MEGDQGTAFLAGVVMTLTVQTALFVLWKLAHLRSEMRAERAGFHVRIVRTGATIGAVHPPRDGTAPSR